MAEFHGFTIVQQPIPFADLMLMDHLVLTRIFDIETPGSMC